MTEELAAYEIFVEISAIHCNKWPVVPRTFFMKCPGDMFFANPGFSEDDAGTGLFCTPDDHPQDRMHRRVGTVSQEIK